MNYRLRFMLSFLIVFVIFIINSYSQEFKPRVNINFIKDNKVKIGEITTIYLNLEALEPVEDVNLDILLPPKITIHQGQVNYQKNSMNKNEKYRHSMQISIDDSIFSRISVRVTTKKENILWIDHADLYFISYDGASEILN